MTAAPSIDWAVNGGEANVACCGCGGGSTAPTNPCETTAAPAPSPAPTPAPAPSPVPTPGCSDKPGDWKSSAGTTCADYVSKAYCTADGGYGSGWDDSSTFDDW